jgi:hypothetical protein
LNEKVVETWNERKKCGLCGSRNHASSGCAKGKEELELADASVGLESDEVSASFSDSGDFFEPKELSLSRSSSFQEELDSPVLTRNNPKGRVRTAESPPRLKKRLVRDELLDDDGEDKLVSRKKKNRSRIDETVVPRMQTLQGLMRTAHIEIMVPGTFSRLIVDPADDQAVLGALLRPWVPEGEEFHEHVEVSSFSKMFQHSFRIICFFNLLKEAEVVPPAFAPAHFEDDILDMREQNIGRAANLVKQRKLAELNEVEDDEEDDEQFELNLFDQQ